MKKIIFSVIILFLFSCNDTTQKNNNQSQSDSTELEIPQIVRVRDKVFSIPSPVQAAYLVKDEEIPFNPELLNPPENYTKYLTTFKQALNIGVYGANMGDLFIYDQLSESAKYFNVIKKLSEQVGILNSIDPKLLDRIENNNDNKDSLLYIMSDLYKEIDSYLLENEQADIGVLILVGGWIESLYLLTKIAVNTHNPEIISRIGEQKTPLNNLIGLLQPYYNQKDESTDELIEKLVNLSIIFDGIEATYTYEPPETNAETKTTIIHSKTTYYITEEDLNKISSNIEEIRNWIIE